MKNIIISQSFVDSLESLNKSQRKRVWRKVDKFAMNDSSNSFSLHGLNRTDCDESFKSARINDDLRLILSHHGDKYILLYVDHHDDAYNWAEGKYLDKNSFGALYIKDNVRLFEAKQEQQLNKYLHSHYKRKGLLEEKEVRQKELEKLGIESEIAEHLINIKDIDAFIDFVNILPEEIAEGMLDIVAGTKSITELYNELNDEGLSSESSFEEALSHKDSKRRFYLVENQEELEYIMKEQSDKWKLFLHPRQRSLVSMNFNGPALIEGGPGTGKTVVGLHRAVYLAQNFFTESNNRILFCTFSRKLTNYLKAKLEELAEQKNAPDIIEISGVDSLIYKLLNIYNLTSGKTDIKRLHKLMEEIYLQMDFSEEFDFYQTEYHEVIQRYHIRSLEEYLSVNRIGRKQGINKNKRKEAWRYFDILLRKKKEHNLIDFEDRAYLVYKALKKGNIEPLYDSIIVDEAQDLSPFKLKVLAGLVREQANNLFLLSDNHQRIFKMQSWRNETGINIVGRTYYLTLNYRTTKQIREFADKQFITSRPTDSYFREYKSVYLGPEPHVKSFSDTSTEYKYLVRTIKSYINNGIDAHNITVISPIEREEIKGILDYEEIKCSLMEHDIFPEKGTGVCISSLQGCKGLEFRIVILANYQDIDKHFRKKVEDEWYNRQKIRQIECLKYVACTRARDELFVTFVE